MTDKTEDKELMVSEMTLRDDFAKSAMNAMISTLRYPLSLRSECDGDFEDLAQLAYERADAMLKARG